MEEEYDIDWVKVDVNLNGDQKMVLRAAVPVTPSDWSALLEPSLRISPTVATLNNLSNGTSVQFFSAGVT